MAAASPRKPRRKKGRHRKPSKHVHWLGVGAVGVGLAAALVNGQGTAAAAAPDDSSRSQKDDHRAGSANSGGDTGASGSRGAPRTSSGHGADRAHGDDSGTDDTDTDTDDTDGIDTGDTGDTDDTDDVDIDDGDDVAEEDAEPEASEGDDDQTWTDSEPDDPEISTPRGEHKAHEESASELSSPEPPPVDSSAATESTPPTEDSTDPVTAEALSSVVTDASDDGSDAPAVSAADESTGAAVTMIGHDLLMQFGITAAGNDGSTPVMPIGSLLQALWLAGRQNHETPAEQLAAIATVVELVGEAALAELSRSIGWIPGVGTAMYATSSLFNLGALGGAVLRGDQADIADEIGDLGRDLVGMIPVVGAPIAGNLYGGITSTFGASAPVTAAPMAVSAAVTDAAAPTPGTAEWYFQESLIRAVGRLIGWPGIARNFVDITNYQTDHTLDSADDQLDALIGNALPGSPARWIPDLLSIFGLFVAPAVPGYSFTDTLNVMGDWLNRVMPRFKIADGAGALGVITPYKIMGAAVAGAATVLQDMLNGIYDPVQIEIDVIRATTGAEVTASDLTDFGALSGKVVLGILGDGGAFSHPERALDVTLPTWTAEQVNPFTVVTYIAFVAVYKRFQEMAALTIFTTSTTYDSWHYTNALGMYAAGTFYAVDPDGATVDFPAGGSLGATYTSAGGALVTVNTTGGGFTYTPPSILGPNAQNAAFFHRATSENEADRYDTVNIPVTSADGVKYTLTFKIQIINGTNANPTGAGSVTNTDALGVVKGKVNGSDSDGDTLTYTLVGSSVNGQSGNSAYTKNGSGNGGIVTINPTTGDFTYVSSATAGATQSFQVRIGDGHHGSAVVTVTVPNTTSISPANVNTSTPYVVTGTAPGSTNLPGVFTSYALGTAPTKGTVTSFNPATGAFTYTSSVGRTTTNDDMVTLLATDASGRTVTLRLAVKPTVVNNVPSVVVTTSPHSVAQAQNSSGNALGTWSLNTSTWTQTTTGKLTWSDADGDPLTYAVNTAGQAGKSNNGGTVTLNADGTFTYTVAKNKAYYHAAAIFSPTQLQNATNGTSPNSAAADWFDVTVSDSYTGGTVTQRVYVPVYAVNATPTIAGNRLGAGSVTFVGTNDADSEDTYGNFQTVVPSGWNYVGSGSKGTNSGSMTRLSGSNTASLTLYDRDGNGNRYYNVDAYGRTTNTQGVTRTW